MKLYNLYEALPIATKVVYRAHCYSPAISIWPTMIGHEGMATIAPPVDKTS